MKKKNIEFFESPPKPFHERHIFNKTIDEFVKRSFPNCEGQHPLFQKFGVRTGGICDCWHFISGWESFPEIEKWKYVALCQKYWLEYQLINSRVEDKEIIFHKTVDELVEMSYPHNEKDNLIFEKFGANTKEGLWEFKGNWKDFPEIEKWKYIALCAIYWNEFIAWKVKYDAYDQYLIYLKEIGDFGEYKRLKILENRGDSY